MNVVVDALPPLFGPAVVPDRSTTPVSRRATPSWRRSRGERRRGRPAQPRLTAEARFNKPEIDFKVTGANALAVARAWQSAFADAAAQQTPAIERVLVQPYSRQLDQASAQFQQQAAVAAKASPDDPSRSSSSRRRKRTTRRRRGSLQSYEVVATTMKAQAFIVVPPHTQSAGVGSTASTPRRRRRDRLAGRRHRRAAAGLRDAASRAGDGSLDSAPSALRREVERRTGSPTR